MIVRHSFNDSPINRGDIQTGREKERSNEALARLRLRVLFSDKIVFRSPGYSLWPDRISKLVCNSVNLSPADIVKAAKSKNPHPQSTHTYYTSVFFVWNFNNFSGENRKRAWLGGIKTVLISGQPQLPLTIPKSPVKKEWCRQ